MASQLVIAPESAKSPVFRRVSLQGSENKNPLPTNKAATRLVPNRLSKNNPEVDVLESERA
jgi:hypothetical protein